MSDDQSAADGDYDVRSTAAKRVRRLLIGLVILLVAVFAYLSSFAINAEAVNVFGTTELMPEVDFTDSTTEPIEVLTLFGTVRVVVAADVRVSVDVTSLGGTKECNQCVAEAELPDLVVNGLSVFGTVTVGQ